MTWRVFCVPPSLHVGKNDQLTFYDGDDLTANILGQYSGTRTRFKLYTSMADVTIQFQSDPATNIFGYNNGFVVHFFGETAVSFVSLLDRGEIGTKEQKISNII